MVDVVNVTSLNQVGRTTSRDPSLPRIYLSDNADFGAPSIREYDFTIANQTLQFGIVRSIGIDNSSNPNPIEVAVSSTDQFFIIPAGSGGYYKIDAVEGSKIQLTSDGGATDKVTVTFYNYDVEPAIWYAFGPINPDIPLSIRGADNATAMTYANPFAVAGQVADGGAFTTQRPVFLAGLDRDTGAIRAVKVDGDGRLDFFSSITIGAVTIADGGDVAQGATTDAPVFDVSDPATVVGLLKGLRAKPSDATISAVSSSTSSVAILAANPLRFGGMLYNDGVADAYVAFAATASTSAYSAKLLAGGSVEIPANYLGPISAVWSMASGSMRVTEFIQ